MLVNRSSHLGKALTQIENHELVTNDVLTKDATEAIQGAIVEVVEYRLNGINDLINSGVSFDLEGGIGTVTSSWEQQSTMTEAQRVMDPRSLAVKDRLTFSNVDVKVPIAAHQWEIGIRTLRSAQKENLPILARHSNLASRKVSEDFEKLLFQGDSELGIAGYTTAVARNEVTTATSWATAANTAITNDIGTGLELLYDDGFEGPYDMYISFDIWANMWKDYSANKGDNTLLDRILQMPGIRSVKPTRFLPNGASILVQITPDVVDLAIGMDIQNIPLVDNGLVIENYVMGSMVPRIKYTMGTGTNASRQSGICHFHI